MEKNTKKERVLSPESEEMLRLLTRSGLVADMNIDDKKFREAKQTRLKKAYHNTELLLKQYRNISWLIEYFPEQIAAELDEPFEDIDKLIDRLDVNMAFGDKKLENRIAGLEKTRLILDRINDALTALKNKPGDGESLYQLIYLTFINPEQLSVNELLYRLNLSHRQYYRLRGLALNILSIRLWSAPKKEIDFWLEMISILETDNQQH